MSTDFTWKESYSAAIAQTDDDKLRERIRAAKGAIDTRLHDLHMEHGGTPEDRQAITDALNGLNTLRREMQTRSPETDSNAA